MLLKSFLTSDILALVLLLLAIVVDVTVCQRPVGIHLDVEPAALSGGAEAHAANFFDMMRKVKAVTSEKTTLTADIPMGMGPAPLGAWAYNGRAMSEYVTDIVDVVSLMAYRDKAAAPDGVLDHSRGVLSYAKRVGKKVTVGVETQCGEVNKITFCEEGDAFLERQLTTVVDDLSGEFGKTFGGISVHHYNAYKSPFTSSSTSRVYCKALWVWDHNLVHDTSARDSFLRFASSRKICTVYMESQGLVDRTDNRPKLTSFIHACHNAGIKVELLFGNNEWVYPKNHAALVSLIQTAVNYIVNFPSQARRDVDDAASVIIDNLSNNATKVL